MKAYKSKLGKPRLADLKTLRAHQATLERPALKKDGPVLVTPKMQAAAKYAVPESHVLKREFQTLLQPAHKTTSPVTHTDKLLFEREMRDVTPLPSSDRMPLNTVSLTPPEMAEAKQHHAMGPTTHALPLVQTSDQFISSSFEHDPTEYLSSACGSDVMRNLRKGRWPIMANLDLHGATLDEARSLVSEFIAECIEHRLKCVRIVHGVGYGSKGQDGPILLPTVRRWLSQLHDVLAYAECATHEGGKGAVKIILRSYR